MGKAMIELSGRLKFLPKKFSSLFGVLFHAALKPQRAGHIVATCGT